MRGEIRKEKLHAPSLGMEEGMLGEQEARVRGAVLERFLEEPVIQGADDPAGGAPRGGAKTKQGEGATVARPELSQGREEHKWAVWNACPPSHMASIA